jgi:light-harvesting protein B-800-850 alpha chain
MNNAKIWLVVKPAVGVPVLLGGVALGSFLVHLAVVSNTDWYGDYVNGRDMAAKTAMAPADANPSLAALHHGVSVASLQAVVK